MKAWGAVTLCLAVCVSLGNGLYFHISETEEKCFIEEVPAETMIVGRSSGSSIDQSINVPL